MKIIGLIGGMSWESSREYYRLINEETRKVLGGLHSAKCILYSVDFAEIEQLQVSGEWGKAGEQLVVAAQRLEKAGAECIVLCTNTMHKVAQQIEGSIKIPFLHIADATSKAICQQNIKTVGLLGTKFTMEQDFYTRYLVQKQGLNVIVPDANDRQIVHDIIYNELCIGQINPASQMQYQRIIAHLVKQGAEGIILGCTEISLLVKQDDFQIQLFDTTEIHAKNAVHLGGLFLIFYGMILKNANCAENVSRSNT